MIVIVPPVLLTSVFVCLGVRRNKQEYSTNDVPCLMMYSVSIENISGFSFPQYLILQHLNRLVHMCHIVKESVLQSQHHFMVMHRKGILPEGRETTTHDTVLFPLQTSYQTEYHLAEERRVGEQRFERLQPQTDYPQSYRQ